MKELKCPRCGAEYWDDRDLDSYICEDCGYEGPMTEINDGTDVEAPVDNEAEDS